MKIRRLIAGALAVCAACGVAAVGAPQDLKRWQKGRGWGWVWGAQDEVGSLNELTVARRSAECRTREENGDAREALPR